jgi:DNA-binding CsgD family transcriptional regulator
VVTQEQLEVAAALGELPALGERSIGRLCIQVLEKFHVHLVVCTADLHIVYATRSAKAILRRCDEGPVARGAEIGPALLAAVNQYLRRREEGRRAAVTMRTRDRALAVHVSCMRVSDAAPAALLIRLETEQRRIADVLEVARERYALTAQEVRLLRLLVEKRGTDEIAERLRIKNGTAKIYLHRLYRKLDVHARGEVLSVLERIRHGR